MATNTGRSPAEAGSGHSSKTEPCSTVSAQSVSVPNAVDYYKEERLRFVDARSLAQRNLATLSDHQLQQCWHSYAGQISYHHADDSGREWDLVPAMVPTIKAIETEIKRRGLPRPTGNYLMSNYERIDWEQSA